MYSNVDVGDREHGTNKKASWCGGVVVGGGGRAAVRKAWGCRNGGGLASNGVQIELRAPLRFCMVRSELHLESVKGTLPNSFFLQ